MKKAEMEFRIIMMIFALIMLIVVIALIYLSKGKLGEFIANLF
jgi:uncharacterized membrane protein